MTPKEKAKSLVDEMSKQTYSFQEYAGANYSVQEIGWEAGKKCALIAVDEILKYVDKFEYGQGEKTTTYTYDYLQEVKQEINLL